MRYGHTRTFAAIIICVLAALLLVGCGTPGPTVVKTKHADNRIRLEHVALNVADPPAIAEWYCKNLGMKIVKEGPPPVNARFICDSGGNMMLELYTNPPDAVPDYRSMNPLILHVAFMVEEIRAVRDKLLEAGATIVEDINTIPTGDQILIMRDPWGLAIQFVKRAQPMLRK